MKNKYNLKIKKGFVDYHVKNLNKTFGDFILRTWYSVESPTEVQCHHELVRDNGFNTTICKDDYYKNHNIDQLKANNLANKMFYSRLFIQANLDIT